MQSFLGHTDTLLNFFKSNQYSFQKENKSFQIDLPRLKKGMVSIQVFAIYVEEENKPDLALKRTIQIIDRFYQLLEQTEQLELIREYADVERVLSQGKIGAILSIEGAEAVFDLSALRILHRLGVRMIQLTWNQRNQLADGIGELAANGGVTLLGREVIKEMNKLDIIIDVSHLAPTSFWDVIKFSEKPAIASHSNCYTICPHPRNLTDQQIIALAEKGGHVGINFAPFLLNKNGKTEINDVINHIDYIRGLVGKRHISLGTDYDGISSTPSGLEDVGKLPNLNRALTQKGYSHQDIEDVFINNWLNFLKKWWD